MEYWDLYDSERKPLNRVHARGEAFSEGEYYVCAEVWVKNSKGQFLITKRHPDKKAGNLWEFTGGGTLAGENTWQTAIRELKEETGIDADRSELSLFATYQKKNYFQDLFLLCRDVALPDIVLQPNETIDARWATVQEIEQMIENEEFVHSVGVRFLMYKDLAAEQ
ncbi:MAG: NUDIX domain-containing protein [Clostridia bacterium]|nr:NUDIX domain-containing protein [Clostridia bacterium]